MRCDVLHKENKDVQILCRSFGHCKMSQSCVLLHYETVWKIHRCKAALQDLIEIKELVTHSFPCCFSTIRSHIWSRDSTVFPQSGTNTRGPMPPATDAFGSTSWAKWFFKCGLTSDQGATWIQMKELTEKITHIYSFYSCHKKGEHQLFSWCKAFGACNTVSGFAWHRFTDILTRGQVAFSKCQLILQLSKLQKKSKQPNQQRSHMIILQFVEAFWFDAYQQQSHFLNLFERAGQRHFRTLEDMDISERWHSKEFQTRPRFLFTAHRSSQLFKRSACASQTRSPTEFPRKFHAGSTVRDPGLAKSHGSGGNAKRQPAMPWEVLPCASCETPTPAN